MSVPANPSAFPGQALGADGMPTEGAEYGMSLRDWFAGQALAGEMASQSPDTGEWSNETAVSYLTKRAAFFYRFADTMLAERAKATGAQS